MILCQLHKAGVPRFAVKVEGREGCMGMCPNCSMGRAHRISRVFVFLTFFSTVHWVAEKDPCESPDRLCGGGWGGG